MIFLLASVNVTYCIKGFQMLNQTHIPGTGPTCNLLSSFYKADSKIVSDYLYYLDHLWIYFHYLFVPLIFPHLVLFPRMSDNF